MAEHEFTVHAMWDAEAGVVTVVDSDVPGLVAEAATTEALIELLRSRIPELVRLNRHPTEDLEGDVAVVVHMEWRDRFRAA